MSWWKHLISGRSEDPTQNTDYYREGTDLLREEKFHEALTSFRLALREKPNDTDVMQQIAVTYTHIGMTDEAIRQYRRVLEVLPEAAGAHYGLAFLLLQRGNVTDGVAHLRAFLTHPPRFEEAARHVAHARAKLVELTGEDGASAEVPSDEQ